MTVHTAGPWLVENEDVDEYYWTVAAERGVVAHAIYVDSPGSEPAPVSIAHANARLIASAPDLLKAARALADAWPTSEDGTGSYGVPHKDVLAAREAALKATGGVVYTERAAAKDEPA